MISSSYRMGMVNTSVVTGIAIAMLLLTAVGKFEI